MPIDLIAADHDSFAPFVGTVFTAAAPAGPVALTLDNVKLLSEATRRDNRVEIDGREHPPRRAFSLTFEGPTEPVLPQGIYRLEHPGCGTLELFLSPFRQDRDCMLYEAGFS